MGWFITTFAEVAEVITGNTPSRKDPENYGSGIPWVKPPDLDSSEPITRTEENLSEIGQKKARLLPPETVMVCCIGSIGRVGISGTTVATNQQINSLVFKPVIIPRFGYYYCRSITSIFQTEARQAVVSILNKSNFEKIKIPVPPISEQRRIVEILDQADALRKKRTEADEKSDRILPTLFLKMFGSPDSWNSSANTKPLGELVKVQGGGTPSKQNPDYWKGRIPWVSPKDMKQDILYDATDHISELAIKESSANLIDAGAVLVVVRGMILVHTVPIALAGVDLAINQDMKALHPKSDCINSTYLFSALKASSSKLLAQVGTAGHGTRKLDTENLLQTPIFVPAKNDLERFQKQLSLGREMIFRINKTKLQLDKLFEILLHRAFSGELTAEWRKAHMNEILQEMEHQSKVLGIPHTVEPKQLGLSLL